MIRATAKFWAKLSYIFREESAAALYLINADASAYRAKERGDAVFELMDQADAIEARLKELDAKMDKGYWVCEDGHEKEGAFLPGEDGAARKCIDCEKPAQFIKRSEMTGQELYEAEKERKEAVQMAEGLRAQVREQEEMIKTHQEHEKSFRAQAERTRGFAELLRKL